MRYVAALLGVLLFSEASAPAQPVVVIDPGHGGTNTGCPGAAAGLYEKRFTLALARELAAQLHRRGIGARLTRTDDRYLTLRERVQWANRQGGDLLISLHANASPDHAQQGFETYLLTAEALDGDARALRTEDGPPRAGVPPRVAHMIDDLERGAAAPAAAALARSLQSRLRELRGEKRDRGVRQGAMDVLYGATMPAVLVEVGFLDHPVEGRELADPEVRARIAAALADGIAAWIDAR
ncbi:MAG TPA: N-acetylmuramoyl-L-alanine amidase [Kofleriaceae bacterium]|jgi:N-acetylmuramoyl-L-alanine amidase|nr:N-acetylmuramoyl-L-alanine amidase [Kofleriaceae bacterium]